MVSSIRKRPPRPCAAIWGWKDELLRASAATDRNRYLFLKGRMRRLPSGLGSFLSTDVISWRAKWALVTERFRRSRRQGQDESIDTFARRRVGAEVAEVLADAMVTGIHGGDPTLLSMPAAFPRLAELEEQHGSVMKGLVQAAKQRRAEAKAKGETYHRPGKLWSFRPGLQLLIDTLRDQLGAPGSPGGEGASVGALFGGTGKLGSLWRRGGPVDGRRRGPRLSRLRTDRSPGGSRSCLKPGPGSHPVQPGRSGGPGISTGRRWFPPGWLWLPGSPARTARPVRGAVVFVDLPRAGTAGIGPDACPVRRVASGRDARLGGRSTVAGRPRRVTVGAGRDWQAGLSPDRARGTGLFPNITWGTWSRVERIEARCRQYPGLFLGGNAFRGIALNDCTEQAEVVAGEVARYLHSKG